MVKLLYSLHGQRYQIGKLPNSLNLLHFTIKRRLGLQRKRGQKYESSIAG